MAAKFTLWREIAIGLVEVSSSGGRGGGCGGNLSINRNSKHVPPFISVKSGGGEQIPIVIAGKHHLFLTSLIAESTQQI